MQQEVLLEKGVILEEVAALTGLVWGLFACAVRPERCRAQQPCLPPSSFFSPCHPVHHATTPPRNTGQLRHEAACARPLGASLAAEANAYQERLRRVTRCTMATISELSLYQVQYVLCGVVLCVACACVCCVAGRGWGC